MRKIFELNEKSRKRFIIVIIIQIILTIVCQILGWVVQKSYDVYTYKQCTYKLSGATECSGYSSDQGDAYINYGCPGPTTKDCSIGQVIRNLYLAGLIMPLVWYGIIAIFTLFIVLCFQNMSFKLKILFISLIFCDLICLIFYFSAVSTINNNSNYQILFSQDTFGVCIALGIFYIFQMMCKIYLNIIAFQYLTQQQELKQKDKDPIPIPIPQQTHQNLYTNPNTIRDINQQPYFQQPNQFQQPQQHQQNQQSQEDAVLNQVILISLQEQKEKEHLRALQKKKEEEELKELQDKLKKEKELELEEIKMIETLKQQEEEEQLKKAIQQSMQMKNNVQQYLPD